MIDMPSTSKQLIGRVLICCTQFKYHIITMSDIVYIKEFNILMTIVLLENNSTTALVNHTKLIYNFITTI